MHKGIFLVFSILMIISGCHSPSSPGLTQQTLRLNIHSEPPTLDPRLVSDTTSGQLSILLFDGLMREIPEGTFEPAIASEVHISEDKKTYTFTLRDALWSNGDQVTAEDFAYAWRWILSPQSNTEIAQKLYVIKNAKAVKEGKKPLSELGISVPNSHTLVVSLENPTPYFLELTALPYYFPINHRIAEKNPGWANNAGADFVSNGPFILEEWEHHNSLLLKKNLLYWDQAAVKLDEIRIYMVEDSNTELSMFEEGEIDWAGTPISIGLPTDAIPSLTKSGKLETHPMVASYFYLYNTKKIPFNNVKIRKAFSYAINREAIVKHILQVGQTPAMGILPPSMALQSEPYFQDHDVKEAKKLFLEGLAELGISLQDLPSITLSYNTSEGHHKIAQAIQQEWNDTFHIPVKLENLEWKVYLDKLHGHDFEIARMGALADYNDPMTFFETYQSPNDPQNFTGWGNPRYSALIENAKKTTDLDKRREDLHAAEKILMDEMPIAPIYFQTTSYVKNPKLKDVYLTPLGSADFKWAYFSEH